jgi:crotonobetainyl-CoA:carnitine CoA-transferase CaiB-like acyl-CoA transferase
MTLAPLQDFKVVELGTMITAPLAAMMLGDLGAEVIKIEREGGDPFRSFNGGLYSPHFVAFNRNKRSVELDLHTERGLAALLDLLVGADVLIDNFRPGVLDRLGLSPARLHISYPKLIHCSITGFGNAGPDCHRPAYDTIGQALSGIASLAIDTAEPKFTGTTISDNVTGMYACYAIMAALIERQRTGKGRRIELNMLEASIAFMPDAFLNLGLLGTVNDPFTRVSFSQSFVVNCSDGKPLALHLSSQEKFWRSLLAVLDAPDIGDDPRFSTRAGRVANYRALADALQDRFVRRRRDEWLSLLSKRDVPFAPVNNVEEAMRNPQLAALGTFRELPLANGDRPVLAPQSPVLFDGMRLSAWSSPPQVGEHTDAYLGHASPQRESDGRLGARNDVNIEGSRGH